MRLLCLTLCCLLLMASCDDGDIIVTNFDFEATDLSICGDDDVLVLYNVSNDDVFESISFRFENDDFTGTTVDRLEIPLDQSNQLVYRTYDDMISGDAYFCTDVPPSQPLVMQEFTSTTGGTAILNTTIVPDTVDEDGDGLSNTFENSDTGQDTDGDGIPDFQDIDDDGDNVPTSSELGDFAPDMFLDKDEDGIPNYLDNDDDNDGTLTINEDEDANGRPINDLNTNGTPLFLDSDSTESFEVVSMIDNVYSVNFRTTVNFTNLTFDGQDVQAIEGDYSLGLLTFENIDVIVTSN